MSASTFPGLRLLALALVILPGCRDRVGSERAAPAPSALEAPPLSSAWQKPRESLLAVGEMAPDFVALAHTGHQVQLSAMLPRPAVVLFLPPLSTQAAASETEDVTRAWLSLRDRVGMVFGVSTDDDVAARDFATERDLPFLLVADVDRAVARSFGVPEGRAVTFVVDTDRTVKRVFDPAVPEGHGQALVGALDELGGPGHPGPAPPAVTRSPAP